MGHNVEMPFNIVGNIHLPKVYANSSQTIGITGEKMKWQKKTKGEIFHITVKKLAKAEKVMYCS